jgi:YVTN family beta-propeller protein
MKYIFLIIFSILQIFIISGCSDNSTNPITPIDPANRGVYVVNEGLYSQNNSSLTYYEFTSKKVVQNVFSTANSGKNLGDTGNDIVISGKTGFVSVNVSNKIEIFDVNTFRSKGTIDLGANSNPRKIFAKDSITAFVTGFSGKVYKINTQSLSIEKEITVGSFPEGIVEANGKLFVANSGLGSGNSISVIDLGTDRVVSTIKVGTNPINLVKDVNNFVYSICTGRYDSADIGGALYKIDPSSNEVLDSMIIKQNPGKAVVTEQNVMFILNNFGVLRVDLNNLSAGSKSFVNGMTINSLYGVVYSIAYDPIEMLLYFGNPKNFTQNGEIAVYNLQGIEVKRFDSGLNPGSMSIINYR